MTFQGNVALVTGSGSGLGMVSVLAFAREGAKVTVADIDIGAGQQMVQMVEKAGGNDLFTKVDVTSEDEILKLRISPA